MKKVFISYSTKETDSALRVKASLEKRGISCWMAPESIPDGSDYLGESPRAIRECDVFLVRISTVSQQSVWVKNEVDTAINAQKVVIPYMLEDCPLNDKFNFLLTGCQRVAGYDNSEEKLERLARRINGGGQEGGTPTPPAPARKPVSEKQPAPPARKSPPPPSYGSSGGRQPVRSPSQGASGGRQPVKSPSQGASGGRAYGKAPKKNSKAGGIVALLLVLALLGAAVYGVAGYRFPTFISPLLPTDDFYTPELLQSYYGSFEAQGETGEGILTLLSCSEDGRIEGYIEIFSGSDYGKYAVSGEILKKRNGGGVTLSLSPGGWQVESENGFRFEEMTLTLPADYSSLSCPEYLISWGSGTDEGRTLEKPDDLAKLQGASGVFFLKNDLDLTGYTHLPIQNFGGTLIGGGHTIRNMTVSSPDNAIGLFSTLSGRVSDLHIENALVEATGRNENVGILCGVLSGSVENITVSGTVSAQNGYNVGGIAGRIADLPFGAKVRGLSSSAEVVGREKVGGLFGSVAPDCEREGDTADFLSLENSGAVKGECYVGGLFGDLYFTGSHAVIHYDFPVNVINCKNSGSVKGVSHVGGIVGKANADTLLSEIRCCSNAAPISAEAMVGCIAGECNMTVSDCQNEGSSLQVSGFLTEGEKKCAYAGGFVGKGAVIKDCKNTVAILYEGSGNFVGGLMGHCAKTGWQSRFENLENLAEIKGCDFVGGLFGAITPPSNGEGDTLTVRSAKNSGNVSGNDFVGGLIGSLYLDGSHAIIHYDFPGYIIGGENSGMIRARSCVGGLVGYGRTDTALSEIIDPVATGEVVGEDQYGAVGGSLENLTVKENS